VVPSKIHITLVTLPKTNIGPENRPLEIRRFLLVSPPFFRGYVKLRGSTALFMSAIFFVILDP